jgi:DNA-directed RNA polymerase subunit M/transcription elongation factor TFIIS
MDYIVKTCPECGGHVWYIQALNKNSCDTCEYEEKEVI